MNELDKITIQANQYWVKHYYLWITKFNYWFHHNLVDFDVTRWVWD